MKTVILCGGKGTRLGERTGGLIPKPMVRVDGKPLLWHVMSCYAGRGFKDFILPLGHMGDVIKRYWHEYQVMSCPDVTFSLTHRHEPKVIYHASRGPGWEVRCVDTGEDSLTWTRIKQLEFVLEPFGDTFFLTYGDGLCDVDPRELLKFHREHGKMVTVTAVKPRGRFGTLALADHGIVTNFHEKPVTDDSWINGGFMVVSSSIFDEGFMSIDCSFEERILPMLAARDELRAYKHDGYWQCVDTPRDLDQVTEDWNEGKPRWMP